MVFAQHKNNITATLDATTMTVTVRQELTYVNSSKDTLNHIILNDWNNAYSSKTTPMAKRFTDEFIKAFHLAKDADRGNTTIGGFIDQNRRSLQWHRPDGHPDLVFVQLQNPIKPGHSFTISFDYTIKLPNERFTHFGFDDKTGNINLRDWYLTPSRYENGFAQYSNENIDDIANAPADYTFTLSAPVGYNIYTDLTGNGKTTSGNLQTVTYSGTNRMGFNLVLELQKNMETFRFPSANIYSNLKDNRVTDVQRAVLVNKISQFTAENLGVYPYESLIITEADYNRSPVYGLSQLPSFLRPFPDSFIFELRFLKTYLNAYLHNTLKLDPRKDNWVYDGIQMQLLTKYIRENYPDEKMMGSLGTWPILRDHHIFNIGLNEQYSYFYLLMARRNLDQPIGDNKSTFIKFNEQISGKYKAGLSFNYLDDYLGEERVISAVKQFYAENQKGTTNRNDFELALRENAGKPVSWFFNTLVDSRDLIDYKIADVDKKKDSIQVTLKNVTGAEVPVSLYGVKKGQNIFKLWVDGFKRDTTFTIARQDADRLVLNREGNIPEYNPRNNQLPLKGFFPNRRPYKFTFFQDLENPAYNQIFYVPGFTYNLYDGLSAGIRFHNKSLLEKPFVFDVNTMYSSNTGQPIGSFSLLFNNYLRDEPGLFNIRYTLSGNTYHYAPDARYYKLTPSVQFRFRPDDFRKNEKQFLNLRQVLVQRESSPYVEQNTHADSYSVFNARYSKINSNISRHFNFYTDVQIADAFGKLSGELQFRRLFNDNRQVNIRVFAGLFIYNDTSGSDFFSFGLDRASDYLFDYNYYGRSETSGLFSQQFIMADGGFKSMLDTRYANKWMTTINGSFNIWNWIELYGDAGLMSNRYSGTEFVYDSGVRLNLVTDYFELYFPVYSSNGFELNDANYGQKIRFVVTLSPSTLISLFTRKWL